MWLVFIPARPNSTREEIFSVCSGILLTNANSATVMVAPRQATMPVMAEAFTTVNQSEKKQWTTNTQNMQILKNYTCYQKWVLTETRWMLLHSHFALCWGQCKIGSCQTQSSMLIPSKREVHGPKSHNNTAILDLLVFILNTFKVT